MLFLIAGVTGNIGRELHTAALRRGHQVRGLGRSPEKVDKSLALESFVVCADYLDYGAYVRACEGVDAVIPAWNQDQRLVLEAQLLLLRAAEKAGVKRFHGMSWGLDFTNFQLGDLSPYDSYLSFAKQAQNTSTIRPCYTFTGGFARSIFGRPGTGVMDADKSMWVREGDPKQNQRVFRVFGHNDWKMNWVAEEDAADFTVALMASEYAEKGGFYRFGCDIFSPVRLKEAFESARGPGSEVKLQLLMDTATIKGAIEQGKSALADVTQDIYLTKQPEVALLEYANAMVTEIGLFEAVDAAKFPDVHRTTMEEYIKQNEWV